MNNDNFLIEKSDLEQAMDVCKYIEEPNLRNRAVANTLAANISEKYFSEIDVDVKSGIHNIAKVLEHVEISDIYLNGSYLDVRFYFEDGDLTIPKNLYNSEIVPIAYMFIKVDAELSGACVSGFIVPSAIDTSKQKGDYYIVAENDLISFYDIQQLLLTTEDIEIPDDFDKQIFDYLDGSLDDVNSFYNVLLKSLDARNKLYNAANVQGLFKFVSLTQDAIDAVKDNIDTTENSEVLINFNADEIGFVSDNDLEIENSDNDEELEEISSVDNSSETEDLSIGILNNEELTIENEEESVEYSTVATPSIDVYDELLKEEVEGESVQIQQENIVSELSVEDLDKQQILEQTQTEIVTENNEVLDDLYGSRDNSKVENYDENVLTYQNNQFMPKKKSSPAVGLLAFLIVVGALGYLGYSQLGQFQQGKVNNVENYASSKNNLPKSQQASSSTKKVQPVKKEVAMPVETIENIKPVNNTNEGISVSIPAIEQDLNASVLVSNLSVKWEVPSSYTSNKSIERYFRKIGKIIQLDLKTELLLLTKPPLTNKIMVEIAFNSDLQKFDVKEIIKSSGDEDIDRIIKQIVSNVLGMNLKTNMSVFKSISGNPILVIQL